MLYSAAKTDGSFLYDKAKVQQIQRTSTGMTGDSLAFTRLPYLALFLRPLRALPYPVAYWSWQAAGALALLGSVLLWTGPPSRYKVAAICGMIPALLHAFINGQDILFVMLFFALAMYLLSTNHPVLSGLILSLCFQKYHLFLLVPVWIIAQRRWAIGLGASLGGAALLGLSFAVGGWQWPLEYLRVLGRSEINPSTTMMPNIHGFLASFNIGFGPEVAMALLVGLSVWYVCRRDSSENAMLAALLGSLLVSYHAYLSDMLLLIPVLAQVWHSGRTAPSRVFALGLICPLIPALFILGRSPWNLALPFCMFGLLATLVIESAKPVEAADSESHR
jgi:hypothetical protein